jgi:hypothetical protein
MKIYKRKIKKHEEVWAEICDEDDMRVRVCIGNSNYGRLYVMSSDGERGYWLNEEETEIAFKFFKEIWSDSVDNNPFRDF